MRERERERVKSGRSSYVPREGCCGDGPYAAEFRNEILISAGRVSKGSPTVLQLNNAHIYKIAKRARLFKSQDCAIFFYVYFPF